VRSERSKRLSNSSEAEAKILDKTLKDPKGVGYLRVTTDSLVSPKPCFLLSVSLVSSAVGVSTAVIRDGHNTDAEAVVDLAALASDNDSRTYDPPFFFKKGLYVDIGSNVTAVLVRYSTDQKKK